MIKFKQILCAFTLMMITGVAVAQNNTNSPYTRYGYGDLSDQYFANSKAMGGVAYGLRDGSHINVLNPASYTAIDSLTFLFEGGVSLQNTNLNDNGLKMNAKNSSLDYLAMQFRMRPWLGMSIGLLPYSNVGYGLTQSYSATATSPSYVKTLSGDGGLHQLYAGVGVKAFEGLSLGMNVSYFWGDIMRTLEMKYADYTSSAAYFDAVGVSISTYKLDFGAQYTKQFDKKRAITLGVVYSPKQLFRSTATRTISASSVHTENEEMDFGLPNSYGFGVSYNYDKRLTLGADYNFQQWSDVSYKNEKVYCDRHRVALGVEYIPNLAGRSYFSLIKYRAGAFYTMPCYKINGLRATHEYGVTAGFGLPVPRSRSMLSISGQFLKTKGLETNMINQTTFRLSIGLTFNERWFFKRRVN
ncbi:MAG: hypothetical protein EOM31_00375 [Bacteroidia bacterium]|nr:hypothetical protein [Bacteroidia bacterium]